MRKIIHCDADCFFVALEMRDDPDIKGIPVAVGGSPGKRGVISTCNYEARAFGVHSAMASAYAKRLCPQLIILPHNMTKYREAAIDMRRVFMDYSDTIEPLSLDEAFLDVTATHHCLGSATLIAKDLRRRIKKEVGITVSAGVAGNKFLAKVASDWQKPNGLTVIEPSRARFFLQHLPVNCIPGVGPASAKKLLSLGISTCYDLQQLGEVELVKQFGQFGERLFQLSRGEDARPVKSREYRKSLSVENTFNRDIVQLDECFTYVPALFEKLSSRLNTVNQKQVIKTGFVKVTFADFQKTTLEISLSEISVKQYRSLFEQAWRRYKKPVRLIGLGVRFKEEEAITDMQLPLFNVS
ncbi:MAG: DNA polymerase-4 [Cellvibrionaceae bacterium]|jgi:DNA polymerase-4